MDVIASGLIAALIAAVAVLLSQWIAAMAPRWNAKTEIEKYDKIESNQSRRAIYEEFISSMFNQMNAVKEHGATDGVDKDLLKVFLDFRSKLLLVGSDEVIRTFNDIDIYNEQSILADGGAQLLAAIADLVIAIRRDLGYPDTKMKRIEILSVFLSDAESIETVLGRPRKRRFKRTISR